MFTFLPNSPVFYTDTCETGCYEETTHRLDEFSYDKKSHKISLRISCVSCEDRARILNEKYKVLFVTFNKEDWVTFISSFNLVEPEN